MYHLKYRPINLNNFIGNRAITSSLSSLNLKDIHAYLFYGMPGTGKTTLSRIIASSLNCHSSEIREINGASASGIDTIRQIENEMRFKPLQGKIKIYLIDEAHRLSTNAQDCLLKDLEEPPPHVYFILCTTEIDKIIETVKSRCHKFQTSPLTDKDMLRLLDFIIKEEKLDITEEILGLIIEISEGIPRTALILLHILKDIKDTDLALELAYKEVYNIKNIVEFCRAIIDKKSWQEIVKIYKSMKDEEPEKIRISMLRYFGGCLTNSKSDNEQKYFTEFMDILNTPLTYISGKQDLLLRLSKINIIWGKTFSYVTKA